MKETTENQKFCQHLWDNCGTGGTVDLVRVGTEVVYHLQVCVANEDLPNWPDKQLKEGVL